MKNANRLIITMLGILMLFFASHCYAYYYTDNNTFTSTGFSEDELQVEEVTTNVPTGAIHCFIEFDGELYAGTDKGLFIEKDGQFKQVDNEFKEKQILHLIYFHGDLVANVEGELFTTSDMKTWIKLPPLPNDKDL